MRDPGKRKWGCGGWGGGRRETRFVAVVVQSINHLLTVIRI